MSFFTGGDASDPHYVALRDAQGDLGERGRRFVDDIWNECRAFVDDNLRDKACDNYIAAFWELYLAHCLRQNGIALVPRAERTPAREGPDLLADDPRVWIEATAPSAGTGEDAVPAPKDGGVWSVPDDRIILRYRSAIADKMKQLNQHRTRDWVKPGDATVIALSGAMIPSARSELTVPRIIRSALPFGSEAFQIDRDTMEVVDRGFEYRPTVTKRKGAAVAVDIFADETHSMLSALLASCADEINRAAQAGADFVLIHNQG